MTRVVIADDQRLVREGLRTMLSLLDGVEVVAVAADGDEAVGAVAAHDPDAEVLAALRAGARGYLTKDAGADEVARAIARVAEGSADLAPEVQRRLLDLLPAAASPLDGPPPDGLTERELDVLRLIATGLSNAEIAAELVVSEATVKTHVNHLFAKTGVRDRAQAVAYAYRHGLVG